MTPYTPKDIAKDLSIDLVDGGSTRKHAEGRSAGAA